MVKMLALSAGGVLLWSAFRHACLEIGMSYPAALCTGAALIAVSWLVATQAERNKKAAEPAAAAGLCEDGRARSQEVPARRA